MAEINSVSVARFRMYWNEEGKQETHLGHSGFDIAAKSQPVNAKPAPTDITVCLGHHNIFKDGHEWHDCHGKGIFWDKSHPTAANLGNS